MPLTPEQAKKIDKEIRKLRKDIGELCPEDRPPAIEHLSYALQYGVLAIIELLEGNKRP